MQANCNSSIQYLSYDTDCKVDFMLKGKRMKTCSYTHVQFGTTLILFK